MDLSPATNTVTDTEEPSEKNGAAESEQAEQAEKIEQAAENQEDAGEQQDEAKPAPKAKLGPGQELSDSELEAELVTLLFACPEVLTLPRLVKLLRNPATERVKVALETVTARLGASPDPIRVRAISGGWRLMTDPSMGEVVARLRKEVKPERISGAGLETLAIVAYRQPVTKSEIEAIRGVQSGQMLRGLVDRGLIKVAGRAETPGSPLQYATSKDFLDRFGLSSLKDLPRDGELVQGS